MHRTILAGFLKVIPGQCFGLDKRRVTSLGALSPWELIVRTLLLDTGPLCSVLARKLKEGYERGHITLGKDEVI